MELAIKILENEAIPKIKGYSNSLKT